MATNTGGGTTASLGNTPQAKDDSFTLIEDYNAIAWLDVMSNDLGGNAKILWSLDDSATDAAGATDLIGTDVGKVCVNMYDLHDTQAKKPGDYVAGGSGHNGDNSVQTNAYNPDSTAFCVQPVADATQVPVGTIGGLGFAVVLGGGLVFTTTRRRRSSTKQSG